VPFDQKLADSLHINSDMRHVCLQLLAADCQVRPLSNSCSAHSQQQQILGSGCADWHTLRLHCSRVQTARWIKPHNRASYWKLGNLWNQREIFVWIAWHTLAFYDSFTNAKLHYIT